MLFSSNVFLFLFLPVVLLGYHVLGRFGRVAVFSWLSLASLTFYGYWNPRYLILLLSSICLNYAASLLIARAQADRTRSILLVSGISANLGLLIYFKYLFPTLQYFYQAGWIHHPISTVLLPLGISFFTFTQIAYLVDLKQGAAEPQSPLSYVLFVTFFPHLIAGPILHHKDMMPQFVAERHDGLRANDMAVGTTWFLLGLSKKVLIADRFSPVADAFFANPTAFGTQATWAGVLAYTLQLYFDFSGYSDMAIGLARMFSITFPFNFDSPFKAENISDFWQRWHMTLTQYIMSYVYGPVQMSVSRWRQNRGLKVSRKAQATLGGLLQMVLFPTMFTMFLAGVWHGAGRQFLWYGVIHGVYLTIYHAWRVRVPETNPVRRLLGTQVSVALTFLAVVCSFVMFRSTSAGNAVKAYAGMLGLHHVPGGLAQFGDTLPQSALITLSRSHFWLEVVLMLIVVWCLPNTQEIMDQVERDGRKPAVLLSRWHWRPSAAWAIAVMALTGGVLLLVHNSTSFLYFQF